jgi:enoyl-CoA hydratase/carnithine racemase
MAEAVLRRQHGGVLWLTLNRPLAAFQEKRRPEFTAVLEDLS